MVPPLLVVGFVAGFFSRGWLVVVVAGVAWPALLLATDVGSGARFLLGAVVVGVVNPAVGLLIAKAARSRRWSRALGSGF